MLELLKLKVQVEAYATDICLKALSVAKNNAAWLGANISFSRSNWFDEIRPLTQKFDLIVVNPPYIGSSHGQYISKRELSFEPELALYGLKPSKDGIKDYKSIISGLNNRTHVGSVLIMEHGSMQKKHIRTLLNSNGLKNFEEINDLSGLPRVVKVRL